jgi:hypothetical protein
MDNFQEEIQDRLLNLIHATDRQLTELKVIAQSDDIGAKHILVFDRAGNEIERQGGLIKQLGDFMGNSQHLKRLAHNAVHHICDEDLIPELQGLLNVYDGLNGAGNYREKIQHAMGWVVSDHPEARSFLFQDLMEAANIADQLKLQR